MVDQVVSSSLFYFIRSKTPPSTTTRKELPSSMFLLTPLLTNSLNTTKKKTLLSFQDIPTQLNAHIQMNLLPLMLTGFTTKLLPSAERFTLPRVRVQELDHSKFSSERNIEEELSQLSLQEEEVRSSETLSNNSRKISMLKTTLPTMEPLTVS